jgi:hypothetical protein
MTEQQARNFAKSILKEAAMIAEAFDGTIGDGAFRNRVATLNDAIDIFMKLAPLSGPSATSYLLEVMQKRRPENDG